MRKILLLIISFAWSAYPLALLTWDGSKNTDFNDSANWTGSVSSGTTLSSGDSCLMNSGSAAATLSASVNIGALKITGGYTGTLSLSTYTLTVSGSTVDLGGATLSGGTSTLSLNGAAAQSITSAGEAWYDITISRSTAGTCTFADALSAHTITISSNTQATTFSGAVSVSGNLTLDGSGAVTLSSSLTATGASSNVHWGSTLGTVTATACALTMNTATAGVIDDDKSLTMKSLSITGSCTNSGAAQTIYSSSTTSLIISNTSALTTNRNIAFLPTAGQTIFNIGTGATWNGTNGPYIGTNTLDTIYIPAVAYTGTGSSTLTYGTAAFHFVLTGAFNIGSATLTISSAVAVESSFRTNGFAITASSLTYGSVSATSKNIYDFGNSTITANSVTQSNAAYTTGYVIDSLKNSIWNVAGNIIYGANRTVVQGTSTISITGATGSILSLAGKRINNLTIVKTSNAVCSLSVAVAGFDSINNFTVTSGKFRQKKHPLWIGGDYLNNATAAGDTVRLDTTVEIRGDWRSFGNRATDGLNSIRYFTGSASPCTTAMTGAGGYFVWRRAKNSILVDSGAISKMMLAMDSIGTLKTLDTTYIDSVTACDSSTFIFAGSKGFKARVFDSSNLSGVSGKVNYYSASSGTVRLYVPATGVTYTSWTGINSANTITATGATNTNGGGNTNITFDAIVTSIIRHIRQGLSTCSGLMTGTD